MHGVNNAYKTSNTTYRRVSALRKREVARQRSSHSAYLENLTVSGKTALAQVQADYAANSTRFT